MEDGVSDVPIYFSTNIEAHQLSTPPIPGYMENMHRGNTMKMDEKPYWSLFPSCRGKIQVIAQ